MVKIKDAIEDFEAFNEFYEKTDKKHVVWFVLVLLAVAVAGYYLYDSNKKIERLEQLIIGLGEEQQDFYMIVGEFEKSIAQSKGSSQKELVAIKKKYQELLSKNNTEDRLIRRSVKGGNGKIYKIKLPKGYVSPKNQDYSKLSKEQRKLADIMRKKSIGSNEDYIFVTNDDFEVSEVVEQDKEYGTYNHLVDDKENPAYTLDTLVKALNYYKSSKQDDDNWRPVTDEFSPESSQGIRK